MFFFVGLGEPNLLRYAKSTGPPPTTSRQAIHYLISVQKSPMLRTGSLLVQHNPWTQSMAGNFGCAHVGGISHEFDDDCDGLDRFPPGPSDSPIPHQTVRHVCQAQGLGRLQNACHPGKTCSP